MKSRTLWIIIIVVVLILVIGYFTNLFGMKKPTTLTTAPKTVSSSIARLLTTNIIDCNSLNQCSLLDAKAARDAGFNMYMIFYNNQNNMYNTNSITCANIFQSALTNATNYLNTLTAAITNTSTNPSQGTCIDSSTRTARQAAYDIYMMFWNNQNSFYNTNSFSCANNYQNILSQAVIYMNNLTNKQNQINACPSIA